MEKVKKFRRSHLILSIPVLASVLLYIHCYALRMFVVGITSLKHDDYSNVVSIVLAVVMLIIHRLWFYPDYKGSFRRDLLKEKSVIIPVAVALVIDFAMIAVSWIDDGVQLPTLEIVTIALMAGIGEEVSYRAIMMSAELRAWIRKGSYLPAILIAAIVFGLSHILNLAAGADPAMIVRQVFGTIAAGVFMGAVFVRTGSILYPIIIHTLHDLLALMTAGSNVVEKGSLSLVDVAMAAGLILVRIIIAVWLLKGRKAEIISVWKERWSIPEDGDTEGA